MAQKVKKGTFYNISGTTYGRDKLISGYDRANKEHSDAHNKHAALMPHLRQNGQLTIIWYNFDFKCANISRTT